MKTLWFGPDPDRYKALRSSMHHNSAEREKLILLGCLFAGCLIAWLFTLAVDAAIYVGWIGGGP